MTYGKEKDSMTDLELLKLARKQSGMSQAGFAGYFQMSKRTLQEWEQGRRKIPEFVLRLMLYKLEIEGYVSDLLKDMDGRELEGDAEERS